MWQLLWQPAYQSVWSSKQRYKFERQKLTTEGRAKEVIRDAAGLRNVYVIIDYIKIIFNFYEYEVRSNCGLTRQTT